MKTPSLVGQLRTVVATLVLAVASLPLTARSQAVAPSPAQTSDTSRPDAEAPLRFEVTSIRAERPEGDASSNRQMLPGGRFLATGTTARAFIRIAMRVDDNRISGAPNWIDTETFAVNAVTANHTEVTTPQQFHQLILSLLEDRFQLKFHREKVAAPVYWLELVKPGKPGPGLKISAADAQPQMSTNTNDGKTVMRVTKMTMKDIAAGLRRQSSRPVEDHTGLAGKYDFQIEWAREETPESEAPSLFTVLKEQLGLKLRPAKGTAETIVIDQISRPSAD